ELDPGVEQDDDLAGGGLDASVDGRAKAERRVQGDGAQALGGAAGKPPGDALVSGVVDHHGLEVGLHVCEDREQPALGVGSPAVDDGEQGDRARCGRASGRRGCNRPELAAGRAVDDVPPTVAQALPQRVGGGEIAKAPALDALGYELFRFLSVQCALRAPGGPIRSSSF
ncbi:MAG TPA: hypothetical protein VFL27_13280, partial [Candidatus Dormibacteraeota bacterium]|nr:hypothetical protein [Candidatus Dormibacteraeota bacterium]